jgi:phosphoglycerate dehydrogenase-like enzyme
VRMWVPTEQVAAGLAGLQGVTVDVVAPDGGSLPASAAQVQFYVPPFLVPGPGPVAAMTQMPRLKVVQTLTAGIDALRPFVPAGAVLCNARGVHDAGTAEWVVAAMLASVRQFPYFAAEQAARRWSYRFTGCLAGKTVLIVGYGSIGAAVERRLSGFDVEILRVARTPRETVRPVADLEALLPAADVVVLLAPVTAETIGMADAAFLALMKDGALLVNAARGSLAVTDDLCAELSSGRLHAALDVTDPEPLAPDHPIWAMPNALITPHVAGSTPASATAGVRFVREQAERFRDGRPLANVITGDY